MSDVVGATVSSSFLGIGDNLRPTNILLIRLKNTQTSREPSAIDIPTYNTIPVKRTSIVRIIRFVVYLVSKTNFSKGKTWGTSNLPKKDNLFTHTDLSKNLSIKYIKTPEVNVATSDLAKGTKSEGLNELRRLLIR